MCIPAAEPRPSHVVQSVKEGVQAERLAMKQRLYLSQCRIAALSWYLPAQIYIPHRRGNSERTEKSPSLITMQRYLRDKDQNKLL